MSYFQNLVDEVLGKQEAIKKRELMPGDIISVVVDDIIRYGIYLGEDEVIHCTGPSNGKNGSSNVAVSNLSQFLTGQTEYSILNFERFNQDLSEKNGCYFLPSTTSPGGFDVVESAEQPFVLFSANDTINRALGLLNDQDGELEINDCHHLFCWAKTGNRECSPILLHKYWDVVKL